jgi:hypothetical protein
MGPTQEYRSNTGLDALKIFYSNEKSEGLVVEATNNSIEMNTFS